MAQEVGQSIEVSMCINTFTIVSTPLHQISIYGVSTRSTLKPLKARMAGRFESVAWDFEREALLKDEYIIRAAKRYGIEPELRFAQPTLDDLGTLDFVLPRDMFEEWRTRHCVNINTNFVVKGKYQ